MASKQAMDGKIRQGILHQRGANRPRWRCKFPISI